MTKIEFAVDVILNQRNAPLRQQRDQPLFVGVRHQAAQRIRKIGHQNAGLDLPVAGSQIQCLNRQPCHRVGGDFQSLYPV